MCATELKDCLVKISAEELSRSKQQLKAALLMRLDSVSASLDSLARQIALFGAPRSKDEMISEIDAVSQDSLHNLVAQLTKGQPAMATVGPVRGVMDADGLSALFAA